MSCWSTTSFDVLINASSSRFFQAYPLYPFLSIIVIETQGRSLAKVRHYKILKGIKLCQI